MEVGVDRLQHGGIDEGGEVALALLLRLVGVDAARNVDREDELEVDRNVLGRAAAPAMIPVAASAAISSRPIRTSRPCRVLLLEA